MGIRITIERTGKDPKSKSDPPPTPPPIPELQTDGPKLRKR